MPYKDREKRNAWFRMWCHRPKNKLKRKLQVYERRKNNPDARKTEYDRKKIIKRYLPWVWAYRNITARCDSKKSRYYKRGIKCYISISELRILWFRDKGWLLEKPTIDRIDSSGNYHVDNCQFIEFIENCRKR